MSFTEQATTEQREAFVTAMAELPTEIEGVQSSAPAPTADSTPATFDVIIVAEFADANVWRGYIEAPAPVAFVNDHVTPLCASWGAIQFDPAATG